MSSTIILPKGLICEQIISSESSDTELRYLEGKYWVASSKQEFFTKLRKRDRFFCEIIERFDINKTPQPFLVRTWVLPQNSYDALRTNQFFDELEGPHTWDVNKMKNRLSIVYGDSKEHIQENIQDIAHLLRSFLQSKESIFPKFGSKVSYKKDTQEFLVFYQQGALHCMIPWRDGWYISSSDEYRKTREEIEGSAKVILEELENLSKLGFTCTEDAWGSCSVQFPTKPIENFICFFPCHEIYEKDKDKGRYVWSRNKRGGVFEYQEIFNVSEDASAVHKSVLCWVFLFSEFYTHDFLFTKNQALSLAKRVQEVPESQAISLMKERYKEISERLGETIEKNKKDVFLVLQQSQNLLVPIVHFLQKYLVRISFVAIALVLLFVSGQYVLEKNRDLSRNPVVGDEPFHQIMDEVYKWNKKEEKVVEKKKLSNYFSDKSNSTAGIYSSMRHFWEGKSQDGVTILITNPNKKIKKRMAKENYERANAIKERWESPDISYANSINHVNLGMWSMLYCLSHDHKEVCLESRDINTKLVEDTDLPTWLRVEAGMNLIYTQNNRKNNMGLEEEKVWVSCSTLVKNLKTAHTYENLNYPVRLCMKYAKSQEEMLSWAILYRQSKPVIAPEHLFSYIRYPNCTSTGKSKYIKKEKKRTATDPSSYCSWLVDSLINKKSRPFPDGIEEGFFANTDKDIFGWVKSKEVIEDHF